MMRVGVPTSEPQRSKYLYVVSVSVMEFLIGTLGKCLGWQILRGGKFLYKNSGKKEGNSEKEKKKKRQIEKRKQLQKT
jgi:guanyl-specific ribonuclease Sa